MTREEAIKTLKGEAWISCSEKWNEALEMVIKALENSEPKTGHWIRAEHTTRHICSECGKLNLSRFKPISLQRLCTRKVSRVLTSTCTRETFTDRMMLLIRGMIKKLLYIWEILELVDILDHNFIKKGGD